MHLCNRVDRRSKSQNISELAFSLNRYHNSATPLFYSETQSDISFLIIQRKDSARRVEEKRKAEGFSFSHPEPQPILSKDSARRVEEKRKRAAFSFSHPEPQPIRFYIAPICFYIAPICFYLGRNRYAVPCSALPCRRGNVAMPAWQRCYAGVATLLCRHGNVVMPAWQRTKLV